MKATKLLAVALLCCCYTLARAELPEITLTLHGQRITVEVASTNAARTHGLMFRRMLPVNRGMLFVFPQAALEAMWMVNTYIPLSVAFIDQRGVIINIEDMQPQTRTPHYAAAPAKYALEANLGWFRQHAVKPGERIGGLQQAPAGR